jgi:hypothetical protein
MGVVPGVVVYNDCPVAHPGDLVAIVPPTQYLGVFGGVLLQPVVGLSEVVHDESGAVIELGG